MHKIVLKFSSYCRSVAKVEIIKVFSFTAISTLVKMLTGLISVKVVASIIGPVGVALIGQLNNFASIVMTVSGGGINSGITKYIAEYKDDADQVKSLLSTAFRITAYCSFVIGLLLITFHSFLSKIVMLSAGYGYVFVIFGVTVLLYALNMMLISIINGFKDFKRYVRISIANSVVGLFFTLFFVFFGGLKGALISVVTYQSVMLLITLWMVRKLPWMDWNYFKGKLDIYISKKYFSYTLMTFTTAATLPISQMLLRGYVISEISPTNAGWWEGMNRISNMYLMVITSSFSVYYLPRLSELDNPKDIRKEIFHSYKVLLPILLGGLLFVYLLRNIIIRILFTSNFLPMENLFIWQLLGDFFKISSWMLSFLMVAKSMTRAFMITETVFTLTFIGLGFLFMNWNGVVGITQGYLVNYILYFLCMIFVFRKLIFQSK